MLAFPSVYIMSPDYIQFSWPSPPPRDFLPLLKYSALLNFLQLRDTLVHICNSGHWRNSVKGLTLEETGLRITWTTQ